MKVKLSDRIRPNSEAAAWVIDEVKKLEAELKFVSDHMESCRSLLNVENNEVLYQKIKDLLIENEDLMITVRELSGEME